MIADERRALAALTFSPAPTPDDVWKRSPFHVAELHQEVVREIFEGVDSARSSDDSNPLGVVLQGPSGSGKTHMLGMVRERIQHEGGYFFLVSLLNGKAFWESTALGMIEGLLHDGGGWDTQLTAFLRRLTAQLGIPAAVRDAVAGSVAPSRADLDTFIVALRRLNRSVGQEAQDTARALVLHGSPDLQAQDIGYAYLSSVEMADPADRTAWGIGLAIRPPQLVVRDISRLLALTGPTVVAIDQLDTLFSQSTSSVLNVGGQPDPREVALLGQVADGLVALRDVTRRTLLVVSCIPDTWALIRTAATPVPDRFRQTSALNRIPDARTGQAIIEKRLDVRFRDARFSPPYPTWPIRPEAFADAPRYTPRGLIRRVGQHITACLRAGEVTELAHLRDDDASDASAEPEEPINDSAGVDLRALDARFADLVGRADVAAALDPRTEDREMPKLLEAGLASWIEEQGTGRRAYKHDILTSTKPALHARLRQVLDENTEDEIHWGVRAIASTSANAVITRIRAASTMAGLDRDAPKRHLVLLRRGSDWYLGPKTRQVIDAFRAAGGRTLDVDVDDLKTFAALRELRDRPDPQLQAWLIARRPASRSTLIRQLLGDEPTPGIAGGGAGDTTDPGDGSSDTTTDAQPDATQVRQPAICLGSTVDSRSPFCLPLESLRKHTAIFAGTGSGKTVLIRRLVEECALHGVSTIVLDPNNDLARLGDAWPDPPTAWGPGDATRAADYLDNTDVVVWTPRWEGGRPLSFQPLPDFSSIRDDPDELGTAVDAAVAALAPRARVDGTTVKAQLGQAVLREALHFYSRQAGKGLRSFIGILAALPDGVSALGRGEKIAAELAETLTAATVNDPLFGGVGSAADPGLLLTPPPGKRARVSVISFVGLHSDEQRQGLVNQLQMALFAWIKRNPAGARPLGGLFVMDEAQTLAPSGAITACTASTIALASQARKYGLGLVFATQAPRGLHNRVTGNAATQFFGLLNHPTQIMAAQELARAKGTSIPEIGLLGAGEFYAATEGSSFARVQMPMSLTYHPRSPLTVEEVVHRARGEG